MMLRTHLAVGIAVALYFLPHVSNKIVFLPVVLIASLLPDIGAVFSMRNRKVFKSMRKLPFAGKVIKTYTLCIAVTILLALFYPVLALPFFLGYSFHLFLDTFTPEGIVPFWPISSKRAEGHIATGGTIDIVILGVFAIFDFALLVKLFL